MDARYSREILVCSACFLDEGLRLQARNLGTESDTTCPNCNGIESKKLTGEQLNELTFQYIYYGSTIRTAYGTANALQFNEYHFGKDTVHEPLWLRNDFDLLRRILKIGFFHYGPQMWRLGEITPLKDLQKNKGSKAVIKRILTEFPKRILPRETAFYRLRKNPKKILSQKEYDSPPNSLVGCGRLDTKKLPVLYCSQNLEICIHECRVTIEDELYIATLELRKECELLDLTGDIVEDPDPFESMRMAIHMLFRAPEHSYKIIRKIAKEAKKRGFDGIIYPSYFSQVHESKETIPNVAFFGRPIRENKISIRCINRLVLNTVIYDYGFGPGGF